LIHEGAERAIAREIEKERDREERRRKTIETSEFVSTGVCATLIRCYPFH